jgi:hypothetical protein
VTIGSKWLAACPNDLELAAGFGELCLSLERFDEATVWLRLAMHLDAECRHPAGARARLLVVKHQKKYG